MDPYTQSGAQKGRVLIRRSGIGHRIAELTGGQAFDQLRPLSNSRKR
jgi:hypothetical protein